MLRDAILFQITPLILDFMTYPYVFTNNHKKGLPINLHTRYTKNEVFH